MDLSPPMISALKLLDRRSPRQTGKTTTKGFIAGNVAAALQRRGLVVYRLQKGRTITMSVHLTAKGRRVVEGLATRSKR